MENLRCAAPGDEGANTAGSAPSVGIVPAILGIAVAATMLLSSGCASSDSSGELVFPKRPVKVIVPFAAGGGSDTFARIVQTAVEEQGLLPQPFVVINVPGAGGTIGSRRVKQARPDGYTILLLHEGILTARHAGQASYGPEAFAKIAGTGEAAQVIATTVDSPYRELSTLMTAASAEPDSIVYAANIGAPSHFAGLMLEAEQAGAQFRYTQTGGGAKRFAALRGGHVDVTSFSIAEFSQFKEAGLRALALLGPERNAEFPDIPTAREQGFDVVSQNMQFWWAPLGTPPEQIERLASAICTAVESPAVQQKLSSLKIEPVTLRGEPLADELAERQERIAAVAPATELDLPNFPAITLGTVLVLAVIAFARARVRRHSKSQPPPPASPSSSLPYWRVASAMLITIIYVVCMQNGWLRFVPATAVYALALGGLLAYPQLTRTRSAAIRITIALLAVAGVMSFAMHYLFTEILVVDLP